MSHLSPEEIEKIKEEQRLRTSETVKTGIRMYFGFVGKVLKYTCGCILILILLGGLAFAVASGIQAVNRRNQAAAYQKTVEVLKKTSESIISGEPELAPAYQPQNEITVVVVPDYPKKPEPTATPERPEIPSPTPYPTLPPGIVETYVIQSDQETPICIARRFNVDVDVLLALNLLDIHSQPPVGSELILPKDGAQWNPSHGTRSLKNHPDTYVVMPGETIYGIACKYGDVFPEEIVLLNGLVEPVSLSPGQELLIP